MLFRPRWGLGGLLCILTVACASAGGPSRPLAFADAEFPQATRYLWTAAECVDGPLELAQLGFSRELFVSRRAKGGWLLTFDSELERDGCSELMVWDAVPTVAGASELQFRGLPAVTLPAEVRCGVAEYGRPLGRMTLAGETLQLQVRDSNFCRGLDVRFRYRRVAPRELTAAEVIRRYVALYNRRAVPELLALFAEDATLVEPLSQATDGRATQHRGRAALRGWFEQAFASAEWSALRLLDLRPGEEPGVIVIDWEYMDPDLAQPLTGQTRFLVGAGQIHVADLQLRAVPVPQIRSRGADRASASGKLD